MAAKLDSPQIFSNLSSKIGQLLFGRTEGDRNIISKTLDELNSLNFKCPVVTAPTKAVLLINQCCTFVPTDDKVLVPKYSRLLENLVKRQNVIIEGRTLTVCVQWCLEALKPNEENVVLEVLKALDAVLRSSKQNLELLIDEIIRNVIIVINQALPQKSSEVLLLGLQCLEACTVIPEDVRSRNGEEYSKYLETCAEVFTRILQSHQHVFEELILCNILQICLSGLQNVILMHPSYLSKEQGILLGIVKSYILYGMKDIEFLSPQRLLPSTLSIPEVTNNPLKEKKGGKLTKQRKHRTSGINSKKQSNNIEVLSGNKSNGYIPATVGIECNHDMSLSVAGGLLKTSDSDFSDNESGWLAKIEQNKGRVRQTALSLFYAVVKQTDKLVMFSYWSSFIPEGSISGKHNLVTCILKDPSARSRMAALNVLLLLLTTSKMFLSQAEFSEKSTAFTPFSVVLGYMLMELHRGLCLALNEFSVPVLTQVLKCVAALVQATPYQKMAPGLITKVVRNVKTHIYHKDASVQVTALIVMGCVLASEPVVSETKQSMLKPVRYSEQGKREVKQVDHDEFNTGSFDFAEFSSEEEDDYTNKCDSDIPWLLKRCLTNLGITFDLSDKAPFAREKNTPAPVKLESLQVISTMSRNYFDCLMSPYLSYLRQVLDSSLGDKYTDLRLHAGRAVDFLGQAINKLLSSGEVNMPLALQECLQFWQGLFEGSLTQLLQNEEHAVLRAVGCDCLGSTGPYIFEHLPRDKQILCVTLLFACTRDDENSVRGAAVRALAICVLYPSLREDPGFVVDTADCICRTLADENLSVKIKASWSLGNLSDALVINSKLSETDMEELPEELLLKLVNESIKCADDNDKIKMNAVRALGNLLQLINDGLICNSSFKDAIEQAFNVLVKCCSSGSNMKVRWNACYALGNALRNQSLYQTETNCRTWQASVFTTLADLVVGFRNFKVRINSAVALSSPQSRNHYGNFFVPTWTALLKALENSQNMEDFTEYKHRDHLVEQICLALGHLTALLHIDDLLPLEEIVSLYLDTLKNHTHRVLERLVPEKATDLFSASCNLATLHTSKALNERQKYVINCLRDVFVTEF